MLQIGQRVVFLESCESTNDVAMELARAGCEHGTIVIANAQTRGKGRLGRRWESYEGNVALSIVVRPNLDIKLSQRLVVASAYAAVLALKQTGICASIKWPNDIFVQPEGSKFIAKFGNFRKIGGILLELVGTQDKIDAAVIGIGINLVAPPQKTEDIPQMYFLDELGVTADKEVFVDFLLEALESILPLVENDSDYTKLHHDYISSSMLIGKEVTVDLGDRAVRGIVEDISLDGALGIQHEGKRELVYFGDVYLCKN